MRQALYRGIREDVFIPETIVEVHAEAMVGRPKVKRYLVKKIKNVEKMPYANMGIYTDTFTSYTSRSNQWYKSNPLNFIWVAPEHLVFLDNNSAAKHILTKFEE
jgi:hypothetical protein